MQAPEQEVIKQGNHARILDDESNAVYRKTSRIVAVQMDKTFIVYTDRGPMTGQPGDWLAMNHPDDDPESDIWTISDERMRSTYEPVER